MKPLHIEAKTMTEPSVGSGALFGELVRAGTMNVSGEEVTGYVVATTIEELRATPRLPMYLTVAIIEAKDWVETQRKIGYLLGALEGLRWLVDGEMRNRIDAIVAKGSLPNTNAQPTAETPGGTHSP